MTLDKLFCHGIIVSMTFVSSTHYEVRCRSVDPAATSSCVGETIFSDTQVAHMRPTIATRALVVDRLGPDAGAFLDREAKRFGEDDYVVELRRWSSFSYDDAETAVDAVRHIVYTTQIVPNPSSESLLDALASHEHDPVVSARVRYVRDEEGSGPAYIVQDVTAAIDAMTEDIARSS